MVKTAASAIAGVVTAALLILIIYSGMHFPRQLEAAMGEGNSRSYALQAGGRTVEVEIVTLVSGDNGPVHVIVTTTGQPPAVLESQFDYDLFQNEDPASYSYGWYDGDWRPDLLLTIYAFTPEQFVVSSEDGRLYRLEGTLEPAGGG